VLAVLLQSLDRTYVIIAGGLVGTEVVEKVIKLGVAAYWRFITVAA